MFANTHYRLTHFPGGFPDSQSDSQRSDRQLLLPVSGNHTDAPVPVPVPIEGGWGFPQLEQRQQVGLYSSISSDVGEAVAVFGYIVRKGSFEYKHTKKHWPESTGRRPALLLPHTLFDPTSIGNRYSQILGHNYPPTNDQKSHAVACLFIV